MERFCLDCNTQLRGRSDKKYCNDICRSHFNNQLHLTDQFVINRINVILKKNRNILKFFLNKGIKRTTRDTLLYKGFDFNYYTQSSVEKRQELTCYCYDFGYFERNSKINIVTKTDQNLRHI